MGSSRVRGLAQRSLAGLVALTLLGAAAACGDDGGDASGPTQGEATTGADPSTDGAGDGAGDGADSGADGPGAPGGSDGCDDVSQETLDAFVPGLVSDDPEPMAMVDLACQWESAQGEGAIILSILRFEGSQFYDRDLVEASTALDLCDDAYVSQDFGLTVGVLDGERVWMFGAQQILIPLDDRMSEEEGIDRLTTFARSVTGC